MRSFIISFSVVLSAVLSVSMPSAAAVEPGVRYIENATAASCPVGYMCLYEGYDYTGLMAYFQWGSPNLAGQGMDNMASSYINYHSRTFCMYDLATYQGARVCAQPGWNSTDMHRPGLQFGDRVSSLRAE